MRQPRVPRFHHKHSGQRYVYINRKLAYLGPLWRANPPEAQDSARLDCESHRPGAVDVGAYWS